MICSPNKNIVVIQPVDAANPTEINIWHDTREAPDNDIDVLLMTLMPKFFSELGISLL
ncbi:hypothetical protein Hanom_Chr02g00141491 [Helianthus anomalus]